MIPGFLPHKFRSIAIQLYQNMQKSKLKKTKHAPLFRRCVATLLPIKYLEPKLSWWDKILLGSSLNFVAFCWGINSSHPTSYI